MVNITKKIVHGDHIWKYTRISKNVLESHFLVVTKEIQAIIQSHIYVLSRYKRFIICEIILIHMQAIRIIDIYAKYIKKINTRLFDKIILIYTHEIYIINMYAKIIDNSYWPFKRKKVRVVQFGSFLNHL